MFIDQGPGQPAMTEVQEWSYKSVQISSLITIEAQSLVFPSSQIIYFPILHLFLTVLFFLTGVHGLSVFTVS